MPPLDDKEVFPSLTEEDVLNYTTPYVNGMYDGCFRLVRFFNT